MATENLDEFDGVDQADSILDIDASFHPLGNPGRDPLPRLHDPITRRNLWTGKPFTLACRNHACCACLPRQVRAAAAALAFAAPTHLLTLTQVGDTWPEVRDRMQVFHTILRRKGCRMQHAYHVEPNPRGTGNHTHGWVWGDIPDDALLNYALERAGLGAQVDLRPTFTSCDVPLVYGMKAINDRTSVPGEDLGELMADYPERARQFLAINGGRLVHATRGYWRDPDGQPLGSQRNAVRAVAARRRRRHYQSDAARSRTSE